MRNRRSGLIQGGLCVMLALGVVAFLPDMAAACPSCREALGSKGGNIPQAYMYSILFMLGMPATIVAVFGVNLGRMLYRAENEHARLLSDGAIPGDPLTPNA